MKILLTHKLIKEKCGSVSFKRGDYLFKNGMVSFRQYGQEFCSADVGGEDGFKVTIELQNKEIRAECNCPKLPSYHKDCQHIAAVLFAIYDKQLAYQEEGEQSDDFMSIFSNKTVRKSRAQIHFETREIIEAEFTLIPVEAPKNQTLMGIGAKCHSIQITDIRKFLKYVNIGKIFHVSRSFIYNPSLHCFSEEDDALLQELARIASDDESIYGSHYSGYKEMLIIPTAAWRKVLHLLLKVSQSRIAHRGKIWTKFKKTEDVLPLQFYFFSEGGPALKAHGFEDLAILEAYSTVLFNGLIKEMDKEDMQRLFHLKEMFSASKERIIKIHSGQIRLFLEKAVPGLKRIGTVHISEEFTAGWLGDSLKAKLYLDRVSNRLLAGLEFHYGKVVINPLEERKIPEGVFLARDSKIEEEILGIMEESLFAKTEEGYFLHNEELEYEFLTQAVPRLQKLAKIYATTAVRNRIFRENSRPQIRVMMKKERTNWLEFKFEMDGISEQEIKGILQGLEEKRKYYRLPNGSLLSLQTKEFNEIQRFLNAPLEGDLGAGSGLPIEKCLSLLDTFEINNVFKLEKSFQNFMENLREPGPDSFKVPKGLESVLKNYQKQGFLWMRNLANYGFGGILADDMGLGKTLQSITYIVSELENLRENSQAILVICPSSVTYNWLAEMKKFAPELKAAVIDGTKRERESIQAGAHKADVLVISYPLLRRDIGWLEEQYFHTIFFDEAQALKNPLTQTARAAAKLKARHRFALTGTPIENSPEELWSIFHIVFPELFRGLKDFSQLTRKQISRRIRPFLLRRMKEEVLEELPKKHEAMESVDLFPEQKKLYAAYLAKLRHDTLKHLDKDTLRKNKIKILAGITRLRQICCHPGLFVEGYKGKSAKLDRLLKILEESLLSGRRVLIFSQFTKMLDLIGRELAWQGTSFFYLDGNTPAEERIEICERFNNGENDISLISLKAGGTGLNLMGADTVILYDTWWNPAVEEQAADRAYRIGQKNDVQVIKMVARGTIEEKINELQDRKRSLIGEIIGEGGANQSFLTEEDIREILMN